MEIKFNIDEIFEIAEQIERNGAMFYRAAADTTPMKAMGAKLISLADMEDEHERTFAHMRLDFVTETKRDIVYESDDLVAQVLQAWASNAVFDMETDPLGVLSAGKSIEEILKIAIGREKDSIAYYEGLKTGLDSHDDRLKIDHIIREEMSHIVILDKELKQLAAGG